MLAKYWKKIGMFILIIACIFNIMTKFVGRISFWEQVKNAAKFVQTSIQE